MCWRWGDWISGRRRPLHHGFPRESGAGVVGRIARDRPAAHTMSIPSRPRARVAVLFHAADRHFAPDRYLIAHLARLWREDGLDVVFVYGTRRFVPADVAIVHVNLSVVPPAYLELARRYPRAINAHIGDVRKRVVSDRLVRRGDGWTGPVIVKTDRNYGGEPERMLARSTLERRFRWARRARRAVDRLRGWPHPMDHEGYRIFGSPSEVPDRLWTHPDLVVERFEPEREGDAFAVRTSLFLGPVSIDQRIVSRAPVVKASGCLRSEAIEPHPDVAAWRRRFHVDYGKIDYVVVDGRALMLDVNKTVGAVRGAPQERSYGDVTRQRRRLADGLHAWLEDDAPAPPP